MKLFSAAIAAFIFAFAFAIPGTASAAGETVDADSAITPRTATFFTNEFSAANWSSEATISTAGPFPGTPTVTPMKVADLGFPPSSTFTFNPSPSMPVCPDDQLGPPPTTNSIPVPQMILRCPNSLIGNGTAVFGLGQSNNPLANLPGEMLVFNGGLSGGLPKIKVYSYSYDTEAGIYTEAVLQADGHLVFNIPRLTADSSVRTLNMDIPGQQVVINKPSLALTVTLPAGQDPNYVQAKCVGGAFPWTTDFTMGSRDAGDQPIGPPEFVISDTGSNACSGIVSAPKIGSFTVSGPAGVKKGRTVTYRAKIKNTGNAPAKGVRLIGSGRGIRFDVPGSSINAGATRTVNVRIRPTRTGKVKATFKVTSSNAGGKTVRKTLTVR